MKHICLGCEEMCQTEPGCEGRVSVYMNNDGVIMEGKYKGMDILEVEAIIKHK